MSYMKEQNSASGKMETNNLPDAEFKTLFIRMLSELRERVDELSENLNKEIKNKNRDGNYKRELVGNEYNI